MLRKCIPIFIWASLLCTAVLLVACAPLAPVEPTPEMKIANPASQNCIDQGGALTIETRGDGGEYGSCTFEDNRQCEEWALFHGDCPVGGIKVTGYATPAARYCAITGGEYQADEAAAATANQEQGTCTFPSGQICEVWEYYNGTCSRTAKASDSPETTTADPFAYCATVGTENMPTDETVNGKLLDAIVQGMIDQDIVSADAPAAIQQAALWRCMDGNVWACTVGANLPCGEKADLSERPTQAMKEFCQANPNADVIPAAATGRATVYSWKCDPKRPQ
jgi:putative hemolysin